MGMGMILLLGIMLHVGLSVDHYDVLGLSSSASDKEIRSAYRSLAQQHHPDKGGDPDEFVRIRDAYEVLGTPEKRRQYDRERRQPFPRQQRRHHPFAGFGNPHFPFPRRRRGGGTRVRIVNGRIIIEEFPDDEMPHFMKRDFTTISLPAQLWNYLLFFFLFLGFPLLLRCIAAVSEEEAEQPEEVHEESTGHEDDSRKRHEPADPPNRSSGWPRVSLDELTAPKTATVVATIEPTAERALSASPPLRRIERVVSASRRFRSALWCPDDDDNNSSLESLCHELTREGRAPWSDRPAVRSLAAIVVNSGGKVRVAVFHPQADDPNCLPVEDQVEHWLTRLMDGSMQEMKVIDR